MDVTWSPFDAMGMKGQGESDLVAVRSFRPPFEGVNRQVTLQMEEHGRDMVSYHRDWDERSGRVLSRSCRPIEASVRGSLKESILRIFRKTWICIYMNYKSPYLHRFGIPWTGTSTPELPTKNKAVYT